MEKFNKEKQTIGSIESFTGGAFASYLTSKPGASKYFKGSIVAYSNEIKEKFNIDTSNGVINKEVALEMAKKGKEILDVDVCVSFTGNAGPESMDNKPAGIVYIAINDQVFELNIKKSRSEVKKDAINFVKNKLNL